MRKLYSFIIAILVSGSISSQCTVFGVNYILTDTTNVNGCFQLGDTLVIDAYTTQQANSLR